MLVDWKVRVLSCALRQSHDSMKKSDDERRTMAWSAPASNRTHSGYSSGSRVRRREYRTELQFCRKSAEMVIDIVVYLQRRLLKYNFQS
jgi:hypothetical protein